MPLPIIQHPTFEVKLPSSKTSVKIRPMLVKEEKILLIAKQSGAKSDIMRAVNQVVNNCIISPKLVAEKLPIFEVEYLFLKIRAVSISNISKVSYKDNEDDKIYDFDIDLDKVEIKFEEKTSNKISVGKDMVLELNYPNAELYSSDELINAGEDTVFEVLLANCLGKIYQGDQAFDAQTSTAEERKQFIEQLPAKSAEQVRVFFGNLPSMFYEIDYKNTKGTDRKIVLSTLEDFFTL